MNWISGESWWLHIKWFHALEWLVWCVNRGKINQFIYFFFEKCIVSWRKRPKLEAVTRAWSDGGCWEETESTSVFKRVILCVVFCLLAFVRTQLLLPSRQWTHSDVHWSTLCIFEPKQASEQGPPRSDHQVLPQTNPVPIFLERRKQEFQNRENYFVYRTSAKVPIWQQFNHWTLPSNVFVDANFVRCCQLGNDHLDILAISLFVSRRR